MITLKIEGDASLAQALARLSDNQQRRDLMDQIAAYGVSSTQQRFLDEKGPEGTPWKQSRRAKKFGGKTLSNKGHLLGSLTGSATPHSASWGSNKIQAAIHQFGGIIRPKNKKALAFAGIDGLVITKKVTMPARPYLGVNQQDREEIVATAHDWMREVLS